MDLYAKRRRKLDDLEQSMLAVPSEGLLLDSRSQDKKNKNCCHQHFSGDCTDGAKCNFLHATHAMKKIALDILACVAKTSKSP